MPYTYSISTSQLPSRMVAHTTVVFVDLTGSTGVYETLGNTKATQAILRLTTWIGQICEAHAGRVVKTLGDGVLAVFPNGTSAIDSVVEMQRNHQKRIEKWPANLRMRLQVGVDSGEVVVVDGDCYGDAVNVASRLSDLSGPDQIWASDSVVEQLPADGADGARCRSLGPISIRGRVETRVVYRIEWQVDIPSEIMTLPGRLDPNAGKPNTPHGEITLAWLDVKTIFDASQMPIHLGRVIGAEFIVKDPRVSRIHARIDWRQGSFVLTDVSSYGSWIRFNGSPGTELALRREECVLHGDGEIALGAPFGDFTVPTVQFWLILPAKAKRLQHTQRATKTREKP